MEKVNESPRASTDEMIKNLCALVHLDIDAIHAYGQAIERIDVEAVCDQLSKFQADHFRHVTELSDYIRDLGGEPPEFARDFKGFLIEGMTFLRSMFGTESALKAMRSNEGLTNATYEKALAWQMPERIRETIKRNRDDERRHLGFIEKALKERAWERKEKVA